MTLIFKTNILLLLHLTKSEDYLLLHLTKSEDLLVDQCIQQDHNNIFSKKISRQHNYQKQTRQ